MLRYLILLCAVVMQMCLGATYSWNAFVEPLRQATGLGQGAVSVPFTVFYIVFPATAVMAGAMLRRFGPRGCAVFGGTLFGCGWILAGFSTGHFLLTIVGIGLLGGMGAGFAYMVPIATTMLWFPRNKALVTGLAVAGFGGGSFVVGKTATWIMRAFAASPYSALLYLGIAFIIIIPLAGAIMRYPKGGRLVAGHMENPAVAIRQPLFWLLYLAMFAGLMGGLTVNANLKQLQPQANVAAATAVGWFALGNALGRIGWGMLFDRIRSITAIRANLLAHAAVLLCAFALIPSGLGFTTFVFLIGLCYGGVLVIYASTAARLWGPEHVGSIYGWMMSSNIPAAFSPTIAGMIFDKTGSFVPFLVLLSILQIFAAIFANHSRLKEPRPRH